MWSISWLAVSLVLAAACTPVQSGAQTETTPVATAPSTPGAATPATTPAPATTAPVPAAAGDHHVVQDDETLRLEATPKIPAALRDRLRQYLNTRSASLSAVSDDGKQVLVETRFGETSQVHLVTAPMAARTQLTFIDEPASSARFVPGGGGDILYSADIGGNEQYQIFHLDASAGRTTRLTDATARNGSALWSRDGKWIAYRSNARNKRDFDIWISNGRDTTSARRLIDGEGYWAPTDWSPDGKSLLVSEYISVNESRLHVVDVASKSVTRLSPEGKASYRGGLFGKDGRTVYVASDREGEFAELYETDVTGSKWRSLTRDLRWDVESMALSPDGRTLAFTINQGGISSLYFVDTRTRRPRPIKNLPRGRISDLSFARKAPVLAFTFSSATRPGDVYTYDLRRRKLTQFTASEMGGLNPDNLIEPSIVEVTSFDGTKIPGLYFRPNVKGPMPVIISIHGGPEGQSRPRFSAFTQYMATENGMAIIYPNVRGSTGYGKSYSMMDNGKKREDSVKDIGAFLDWIAQQPELDASRVGVIGGSYGGYMVLSSLVHYSDRIVAAVDIVGISNFVTFLQNTKAYRRDLRRVEYGDERDADMREFLTRISPTTSVDKIKSALFVAQGANDPRVPESESAQIVQAVREAGNDVWYMLAKNEGHGFRKKENRDIFSQLTILFFEKHLRAGQ